MTTREEAEEFWRGDFGRQYAARSPGDSHAVQDMLRKIIDRRPIHSAIELGAGTGANIRALFMLNPGLELAAVEINESALAQVMPHAERIHGSLLDFDPAGRQWDLAFTRGVLIHIPPEHLPQAYAALYRASRKYILLAEYYNPARVEIPYRGQAGRLWKADFAGEMLDAYKDLHLVDYGFVYHRDPLHPQDDVTWFLLEKQAR